MLPQWLTPMVRTSAHVALTDRCTLERQITSTGTLGQPVTTWQTVAAEVPCYVLSLGQPRGSDTVIVAHQEHLRQALRLALPAHSAVYPWTLAVDMRVILSNGQIYQLIAIEESLTEEIFRYALIAR